MRIAVSGPVGAGKTTLVKALAGALSLPVIGEGMVALHAAQVAFRTAEKRRESLEDRNKALTRWVQAHLDWCADRGRRYDEHPHFVADRWELDLLTFWLQSFATYETEDVTRSLQSTVKQRVNEFDLLVVLPPGEFPVSALNEDGLPRSSNYNRGLATYFMLAGALGVVAGSVATYIPSRVEPLEKRVEDILRLTGR